MEDQNHQIEPNANLRAIREAQKLTQADFAGLMGVPLRTYQDLEAGRAETRPVHINALKWGLHQRRQDGEGAKTWPSPEYQWFAGTNEERCEIGPEPTREAAMSAFRSDYDGAAGHLWEAAHTPIHIAQYLPDIEDLMEKVSENYSNGDQCDEDGDCPIDLDGDQQASLRKAIHAAVDQWQIENCYFPLPWVFSHSRVHETIPALTGDDSNGEDDVESEGHTAQPEGEAS